MKLGFFFSVSVVPLFFAEERISLRAGDWLSIHVKPLVFNLIGGGRRAAFNPSAHSGVEMDHCLGGFVI